MKSIRQSHSGKADLIHFKSVKVFKNTPFTCLRTSSFDLKIDHIYEEHYGNNFN